MSEERLAILEMLSQGKITVEEAEKLLKAVGETRPGPEEDPVGPQKSRGGGDLTDTLQQVVEDVRRAAQSVPVSEIAQTVSREVRRALETLQNVDMTRVVNEVTERVKEGMGGIMEGNGEAQLDEEEAWTFAAEGVVQVVAQTTNGSVQIVGADQDEVTVQATTRVRAATEEMARQYLEQVEVQGFRDGDTVRVTNEPPDLPRGVGVQVSYQIQCPYRMDVGLSTVNGAVRCTHLEGTLLAESRNGAIKLLGISGSVEARTRNGSIHAAVDRVTGEVVLDSRNGSIDLDLAAGQGVVTVSTVNGSLDVKLPEDFAGHLDVSTRNGKIRHELELTQVEESTRQHLAGRLGEEGKSELRLLTRNGSVRLGRSRSGERAR